MKKVSRKQKEELLLLLEERERRRSILYWLNGKVNEKGIPVTLEEHEFQKDIWEDFSPLIYVRKAAQIGVSTVFILKCLYLLERFGYNIIYTLPTLMNDVNKLYLQVDYYCSKPVQAGTGYGDPKAHRHGVLVLRRDNE